MSYTEICQCGHDKASHYKDQALGTIHSCLCSGCNCRRYVHESEGTRRTPVLPRINFDQPPKARPHEASSCTCEGCWRWDYWHRQYGTP